MLWGYAALLLGLYFVYKKNRKGWIRLFAAGIESERLLLESRSTSTSENISYSLEILKDLTEINRLKLAVVTSDFHLFRAKMLLAFEGVDAYGIKAETPKTVKAEYHIREYIALIKTWMERR